MSKFAIGQMYADLFQLTKDATQFREDVKERFINNYTDNGRSVEAAEQAALDYIQFIQELDKRFQDELEKKNT